MFQKPMLKEYAVVVKGNRDTVRQPDHGLQRALNGDREALGHLFASQTPRLYRAALRILGKPQDAEEALQDGFLSAIRHLGEFECSVRLLNLVNSYCDKRRPDAIAQGPSRSAHVV